MNFNKKRKTRVREKDGSESAIRQQNENQEETFCGSESEAVPSQRSIAQRPDVGSQSLGKSGLFINAPHALTAAENLLVKEITPAAFYLDTLQILFRAMKLSSNYSFVK